MKKLMAMLLCAAMLLCLFGCGGADAGSPAGEQREALVASVEGSARILRGDGSAEQIAQGAKLAKGDSVVTSENSTVTLTLDGNKTLTISPLSEIMFNTLSNDNGGAQTVIVVKSGSLANSVDVKLEEGDIYEVCTGDMTMAIRGTDAYVEVGEKGTQISLLTGYSYVNNYSDGVVYIVPTGMSGAFAENLSPKFNYINLEEFAGRSAAAAAMLEKVEEEDSSFTDDFETELRDSYVCTDSSYAFAVETRMSNVEPTVASAAVSGSKTDDSAEDNAAAAQSAAVAVDVSSAVIVAPDGSLKTVSILSTPARTSKTGSASRTAPVSVQTPITAKPAANAGKTNNTTTNNTPAAPTNPTSNPTQPSTDPASDPTQPSTDPTDPGHNWPDWPDWPDWPNWPDWPGTDPTSQPETDPTTQPETDPTTQPETDPTTQPETDPTQPDPVNPVPPTPSEPTRLVTLYGLTAMAKDNGGVYESIVNDSTVLCSKTVTQSNPSSSYTYTAPNGDSFSFTLSYWSGDPNLRPSYDSSKYNDVYSRCVVTEVN